MGQTSRISSFFTRRAKKTLSEGRSRPQELEVSPRSGLYLLVCRKVLWFSSRNSYSPITSQLTESLQLPLTVTSLSRLKAPLHLYLPVHQYLFCLPASSGAFLPQACSANSVNTSAWTEYYCQLCKSPLVEPPQWPLQLLQYGCYFAFRSWEQGRSWLEL